MTIGEHSISSNSMARHDITSEEYQESHRRRHALLHQHLDELAADYFAETGRLPSKHTIMDLIEWSYQQTLPPKPNKATEKPNDKEIPT